MQWIASHWAVVIAPCLVTIIASCINVTQTLPDCPAKTWGGAILRTLYRLLVDLPAARTMKGAHRKWTAPFASFSRRRKIGDLPKLSATLMLALLFLGFASSGCHAPTAKDITDCAKAAGSDSYAHVMPIVADLVVYGSDWKAELTELVSVYGKPFVDCIVQRLFTTWDGQLKDGLHVSASSIQGRARTAEWLGVK